MSESAETSTKTAERQAVVGTVSSKAGKTAAPTAQTEQVIITRSVDTGEIVNVEKIDANGARGAITEADVQKIVGEDEIAEISTALDAAFDAGVLDVLGGSISSEEQADEDVVIERLMLLRLLGRRLGSTVGALRRDMVRRLILRRMVREHVAQS